MNQIKKYKDHLPRNNINRVTQGNSVKIAVRIRQNTRAKLL